MRRHDHYEQRSDDGGELSSNWIDWMCPVVLLGPTEGSLSLSSNGAVVPCFFRGGFHSIMQLGLPQFWCLYVVRDKWTEQRTNTHPIHTIGYSKKYRIN